MAYADITAAIKTVIESATGTANVYEYRRYNSGHEDDMKTLFQSGSTINTWQISRSAVESEFNGTGNCVVDRIQEFIINGYYQIDDTNASEKTFQNIIDNIMDKFDALTNKDLSGNISHYAKPSQLTTVESVLYGSVGCWWCEIRIYPLNTVSI